MRYLYTLLFAFVMGGCLSAQVCFQGQILEQETGEPMIGAAILLVDSNFGTVTDMGGHFYFCPSISEREEYTLSISYTGFATKELDIPHVHLDSSFTIYLDQSAMALDEIVVIGYAQPLTEQDNTTASSAITVQSLTRAEARRRSRRDRRASARRDSNSDPIRSEQYNEINENIFISTAVEAISTFSADVDRASYANVRRMLSSGQRPPADAVRIEEMINYFRYTDTPPPTNSDHPVTARSELTQCPWNESHYLLRIGLRTQGLIPGQKLPSNYVFLVDVSGSMGSADKLPLVKQSLELLAHHLGPEDKISIVTYAGATKVVLPGVQGDDSSTIVSALDQLNSGGGTAGAAGIELAYQLAKDNYMEGGNNRVILATDGDFNVGLRSQADLVRMIERKRDQGIFLTVLGYGTGNYQDGTMQELANRGNGNHAYIDKPSEAKKVLVDELGGTLHTIAKDVKFQLEFDMDLVKAYRLIGYENRLLNNEDFDDDTKDAGEIGAGHTVTVLYEIIPGAEPAPRQNLAELHIRYKPADRNRSRRLDWDVYAQLQDWGQTSLDTRWAAAVAEFGMLLRDSSNKGTANWAHCLQLAREAVGRDRNNYRAEMIGLIEQAMAVVP